MKFIDSDTIMKYLNEAQLFYLNNLVAGMDYVSAVLAANANIVKLNKLIDTVQITDITASTIYNKAHRIDFSANHVLPIDIIVKGTHSKIKEDVSEGVVSLSTYPINFTDIKKYLTNNYNTPILLRPVYTVDYNGQYGLGTPTAKSLLLITDKFTTISSTDVFAVVVKYPTALSLATPTAISEFEINTHEDIVRIAVDKALQDKTKLNSGEKE